MTELEIVEKTEPVLTADELTEQGLTPIEPEQQEVTEVKTEPIVEEKKESLFDKFKKPEVKTGETPLTDAQKAERLEKETFKAKVIESEEYKNISAEIAQLKSEGELTKTEIKKYKDNAIAKLFEKDLTEIDPKEFAKKLLGEDFTKLSAEDLITKDAQLKFSKLSGEDLEEAIRDEIEGFENLKPYEQKQKLAEVVEKLEKSQPDNEVLKLVNELKDRQKETNAPDPEKYLSRDAVSEKVSSISSEYDTIGKGFIGQDYMGYILKAEDVPLIKQVFEDAANKFSVDKIWIRDFKAATYDKAVLEAEKRGYEKGIIEKANPSRNDTTAAVLQIKNTGKGIETATESDIKNIP